MSDQQADTTHHISDDSVDAGGALAGSHAAAGEVRIDSPNLAPGHGDTRANAPKKEAPRVYGPNGAPKVMIMAPQRERSWEDFVNSEPQPEPAHHEATPRRRISAIAAVIVLAAVTGAIGGSFATAGLGQLFGPDTSKAAAGHSLEEHIARLDADVAALKSETDRAARQSASARAKFGDRLEKLEKAQAEPAQKLARLSETVEKLRSTPPTPVAAATPAPAPAAVASLPARDVTGSINAPAPTPAPKPPELARLPLVDGWRLLDVVPGGGATIEGRAGVFEIYAGDPVPGLGRVDAIRKQDGRWTVVTTRGLIVAR